MSKANEFLNESNSIDEEESLYFNLYINKLLVIKKLITDGSRDIGEAITKLVDDIKNDKPNISPSINSVTSELDDLKTSVKKLIVILDRLDSE